MDSLWALGLHDTQVGARGGSGTFEDRWQIGRTLAGLLAVYIIARSAATGETRIAATTSFPKGSGNADLEAEGIRQVDDLHFEPCVTRS